jgi:hypothetical integral membrane protein (TIGR02206 family)
VPFRLFGPDHLLALALTALLAGALARLVERNPGGRAALGVRVGLVGFLLGAILAFFVRESTYRRLEVWDFLPLHLCDFLIFLAVFALVTLSPRACELLYFWSGGTLLAMLTPDLAAGFPEPYFFVFFGLHGGVVMAAAVLVFGFGRRPGPGAPKRAFLLTLAYAAVVGAFNLAWDTNFLFLCRKPERPTLLDFFGPWPLYLVTAAGVAIVLFHLMAWPFRSGKKAPFPTGEGGVPPAA